MADIISLIDDHKLKGTAHTAIEDEPFSLLTLILNSLYWKVGAIMQSLEIIIISPALFTNLNITTALYDFQSFLERHYQDYWLLNLITSPGSSASVKRAKKHKAARAASSVLQLKDSNTRSKSLLKPRSKLSFRATSKKTKAILPIQMSLK